MYSVANFIRGTGSREIPLPPKKSETPGYFTNQNQFSSDKPNLELTSYIPRPPQKPTHSYDDPIYYSNPNQYRADKFNKLVRKK